MKRIVIITGSTRGLGWGTAQALAKKGFTVALLGRNPAKLEERARELREQAEEVYFFPLDLAETASIKNASRWVAETFPDGFDLLVNNAGIFAEANAAPYSSEKTALTMQVNTLGPLQLTSAIMPLLARRHGNVVNVSSGMGSLTEMDAGYVGYRLSKAALNAATRVLSQEWPACRVNSVCPGWVRTDMGGPGAERSIEEGVSSILWAALLGKDGPSGGFYRDGKPLPW